MRSPRLLDQQDVPLDDRVLKGKAVPKDWVVEVLVILDQHHNRCDEMLSPAKVLSLLSGHFPEIIAHFSHDQSNYLLIRLADLLLYDSS